ncbi:MAG: transcriptional regulator EpsA [Nitrosospira sp.]|nr:transcriptional regulator EpsA [Nitrosospira sp.]
MYSETPNADSSLPLSDDHVERYARIIREWLAVRRHYDLFLWLQGEIQYYLPHEIMLAGWGDFNSTLVRHDIVSALIGVRTGRSNKRSLSPLLQGLFNRWIELGRTPYVLGVGDSGFLLEERALQCPLGVAAQGMQSILIHGISDKRGQHHCVYLLFSSTEKFRASSFRAVNILLPYLDTALGQIEPLPSPAESGPPPKRREDYGLTRSEIDVMNWTKIGKTTSEIAAILGISTYKVKNYVREIFRKLDAHSDYGSDQLHYGDTKTNNPLF